jgi:hypothetical protein
MGTCKRVGFLIVVNHYISLKLSNLDMQFYLTCLLHHISLFLLESFFFAPNIWTSQGL